MSPILALDPSGDIQGTHEVPRFVASIGEAIALILEDRREVGRAG